MNTYIFERVYGQVSSKQKANDLYRELVPELKALLECGSPLDEPQVEDIIRAVS